MVPRDSIASCARNASASGYRPPIRTCTFPSSTRRKSSALRLSSASRVGTWSGNVLQVSNAVNLLELVLAQSDLRTLDVLFQVLDRRGAGDGEDRW